MTTEYRKVQWELMFPDELEKPSGNARSSTLPTACASRMVPKMPSGWMRSRLMGSLSVRRQAMAASWLRRITGISMRLAGLASGRMARWDRSLAIGPRLYHPGSTLKISATTSGRRMPWVSTLRSCSPVITGRTGRTCRFWCACCSRLSAPVFILYRNSSPITKDSQVMGMRPPTTLASAPSIPATTTTTLACVNDSRMFSNR